MSHDEAIIDVRGLLTIDVDSELRKLSRAQLQGPWQVPAEAVRRSLRSGARNVDVSLGRHRARIRDDGEGIPKEHLGWVATLLHAGGSNEDRHTALTALESAGELVLLAIAGLGCRAVRIESTHGGRRWTLEYRHGRAPRLQVQDGQAGAGCEVTLHAGDLDRQQCAEWLSNAARFAPANVCIDGKAVSDGLGDTFVSASLRPPLRGRIGLPVEGETAHAWLLEHGLVTGHVAIPDVPPFEAAVELGSSASDLSAARLRERVQPHIVELVDQAAALIVHLGRRTNEYPEPARARIGRLVLQAARKRLRFEEMVELPAFRAIENGAPRFIDLVSLRRSAQKDPSGARILAALYPSQKPERFALGMVPVLVADEVERSRLAELMQVRLCPPDPRDGSHALLPSLRRALDVSTRALGRAVDLLRHPFRSPPVPDAGLQPRELAFVQALRTELTGSVHGADMCAGKGPIRRSRGPMPHLLLPRENPDVIAGVSTFARDPAWLYPIALMLLGGRDLPPPATRRRWLAKLSRRGDRKSGGAKTGAPSFLEDFTVPGD